MAWFHKHAMHPDAVAEAAALRNSGPYYKAAWLVALAALDAQLLRPLDKPDFAALKLVPLNTINGFVIYAIEGDPSIFPLSGFSSKLFPAWVFFAVSDDILLVLAWASGAADKHEKAVKLSKDRLENWEHWAQAQFPEAQ